MIINLLNGGITQENVETMVYQEFEKMYILGMDQCCSTLKVNGIGSGNKYFESAMGQYQYSGTSLGKPKYTIEVAGKQCDIVYKEDNYEERYTRHSTDPAFDPSSISYRYEAPHHFWKVISRLCCISTTLYKYTL